MQTSIDLPEELLLQAEKRAALDGISLEQFVTEALRDRLGRSKARTRRLPPGIGSPSDPPIQLLTREQIDEAMFGYDMPPLLPDSDPR